MPTSFVANAVLALLTKVPPQVLVIVVLAIVIAPGAVGNTSVNVGPSVGPVSATELLLDRTIRKVDTPVTGKIGLVKKDLVITGAASTVMSSVAAVPLDPATGPVTVKPPAGMVLIFSPTVVPVIVAITVQEPLAGIVPAVSETVEPLAVLVPTQVPSGRDAVKPLGSVSVKAAPVMGAAVGLLNVMVSVAVLFSGTMATLKALVMLGRATFKVALVATAFGPMLEFTPPAPAGIVLV